MTVVLVLRLFVNYQTTKARGVKLGRPSKMNDGMKQVIVLLRDKGMGIKQIAKELQIGIGTIYSVI